MKIRTQLVLCGLLPILIVLSIVLAIHISEMRSLSNDWVDRVRANMIEKETESAKVRTGDKADLSRLIFSRSVNNMELLLEYSKSSSVKGFPFNYPLFYTVPPLSQAPEPLSSTARDPRLHTSIHSGWYINGINNAGQRDAHAAATPDISNLDNPFYNLYEANKDYLNVYFGRESDGHYQTGPFTESTFNTGNYISCVDQQPFTGYDPRLRPWFCEADADRNRTVLTAPYNDALTNEVLITMARYSNESYPGEGVFGLDVKLGDLSDSITGSTILQNGKFYIVTEDGVAVLYPGIDLDNVRRFEDIILDSQSEKTAFATTWQQVISSDTYNGKFTRNGNEWLIVSEKVIPDDLNNAVLLQNIDVSDINIPYLIIAVVPQSDIEKAANDIKSSADDDINISLGINIAVIVAFAILMGLFFWFFSNRIVKPLVTFEKMVQGLQAGNLDCNLEDLNKDMFQTSSDMTNLTKAMQNLFVFLRAGNMSYWNGKLDDAYANYAEVEKLAGKDNLKVLGALENNRGAVRQGQERFEEANAHYLKAIQIAEQLYAQAEHDNKPAEMFKQKAIIRNRKMNQASLGVEIMKQDPSIQDAVKANIDEVLALCQAAEDMMGIAKTKGHEGRYWQVIGDYQAAYQCYDVAYRTICDFAQSKPDEFAKQKHSLDYATYNLAEFFTNEAERQGITAFYNDALARCKEFNERSRTHGKVPQDLLIRFIQLQLIIAEKMGRSDIVEGLESTIRNHPDLSKAMGGGTSSSGPKFMDFTIDISGSMGGSRINAVASSLNTLYNEIFNPDDKACITVYNEYVTPQTNNNYLPKSQVGHLLTRRGSQWGTGGMTNFYGAVWVTLQRITKLQSQNPTGPAINVFILTDGSNTTTPRSITHLNENETHKANLAMIRSSRINLILFTIGTDYNRTEIRDMVEAAQQTPGCFGIHLKAGGSVDDIRDRFQEVQKIMATGQLNVEAFV